MILIYSELQLLQFSNVRQPHRHPWVERSKIEANCAGVACASDKTPPSPQMASPGLLHKLALQCIRALGGDDALQVVVIAKVAKLDLDLMSKHGPVS